MSPEEDPTAVDVPDARPPYTRIIDVSDPGEEHQIGVWGYPMWVSAGDVVEGGDQRWRVTRLRLLLPMITPESRRRRRCVLHVEVERLDADGLTPSERLSRREGDS